MIHEVNLERMLQDIHWLVTNTPYRLAGSLAEYQASTYICDQMKKAGLEVNNDEFFTYNSEPLTSAVEIILPVPEPLVSLPCAHIHSTKPEGEIFDLVFVGDGSYNAYKNLDVKGKVVLIEVSYAPPVPEKARIAAEMGAAGIICMNWGNDEEVICHRGLKAVWGNPTENTVSNIPNLIGVGITRNAGLKLKKYYLAGLDVKVKISASANKKWSMVHQPVGIIRGNGNDDQIILVSAHIDAWCPGVTCNATGNSTALEICRILAKHADELNRDVYFVFWNGHEIAEAAGSTWFVDNYWDLLSKKCIAYINIDSTGLIQTKIYEIKASDELLDFSTHMYREFSEDKPLRSMTLQKIGDQSFMGIGIPAISERMSFTKEDMEAAHGATLGWWNHTDQDGIDKCDPETLRYDTQSTLQLIFKLATIKKLPYDFNNFFVKRIKQVSDLSSQYGNHIDFSDITRNLEIAENNVMEMQRLGGNLQGEEEIRLYNRYMMSVSRFLTNVFTTYADKYQQDSYGYTKLNTSIALFFDLERLAKLEKNTFEYGMVSTQIVKNKNRINDALNQVIELSQLYKALLNAKSEVKV